MFYFTAFIRPEKIAVDGTTQIVIAIRKKGQRAKFNTGIRVTAADWDKATGQLRPGAIGAKQINQLISARIVAVRVRAYEIEAAQPDIMPSELLPLLKGETQEDNRDLFLAALRRYTQRPMAERTRDIYLSTQTAIYKFRRDAAQLKFADITVAWLREFETFLAKTSPSANARAIHMRNIRAIFNYAIDAGLTEVYPFRRFKIRNEATRKRALSVDQLRTLINAELPEWQHRHRDFFLLSFALLGINTIDLCSLRHGDLIGDRIEFSRAKTHRLYSIKVEPEAEEIIKRYRGDSLLLNFADGLKNYRMYYNRLSIALRDIGDSLKLPGLSSYWARHTWATIAASLDIPRDTIAHALGHGGNTVTDIYIDFDQAKVDQANRRVLDWVLYGKK